MLVVSHKPVLWVEITPKDNLSTQAQRGKCLCDKLVPLNFFVFSLTPARWNEHVFK